MPQVSILIPAYNVENYIEQALESITNQSYQDYEVVIVDDGSTDSTRERITNYLSKNNNIRMIVQQNQGVSAARNSALKEAIGTYIIFMDPDDTLEVNHLEALSQSAEQTGADLIRSTSYQIVYEATGKQETIHEDLDGLTTEEYIQRMFWSKSFMERNRIGSAVWLAMYRRSLLTKHYLQFDTALRFGEDTLFHMQAAYSANRIAFSSNPGYRYLVNAHSATQKYTSTYFDKHYLAFTKQRIFLQEVKHPDIDPVFDVALVDLVLKAIKNEKKAPTPVTERIQRIQRLLQNNDLKTATNRLVRASIPMNYRLKLILLHYRQAWVLYRLL